MKRETLRKDLYAFRATEQSRGVFKFTVGIRIK